ncbi:hypothetical protein AGABI2DRAFT_192274 [Agaricus bisporus var. bisporus H97]|uniref:hypothetical protein n=1 Tax=Agaricus bisporus var. bisporus (strain H97 / ATCC MYA-4626 / FGSC 10389) TaxID=936046 RepID=UPI00029F522E|nr:hypothetical protein AGABI2DRAFT_192274 [Agaricus bisporus var. bisporus H97]EKV46989.1 hypothetical protein AGABI2DRAFT_192274 [Agaricus bisporus var. bisporus H97]
MPGSLNLAENSAHLDLKPELESMLDQQSTEKNAQALKNDLIIEVHSASEVSRGIEVYRLYKRRYAGLVALIFLNIVSGMPAPWFGPIANNVVVDFDISLDKVTWLGNIILLTFLPIAPSIPYISAKYGLRRCFELGAITLIVSGWVRFAGTALSLSGGRAYALLFIGQILAGFSQAVYQVLGPRYSEMWFGLKGRTTATMAIAISGPVGSGLGQLLSPIVGDSRQSILVLAIMSSAVTPLVFLIGNAPTLPPTYAGSKSSPPFISLFLAMIGKQVPPEAYMTIRERIDFAIMIIIFGSLVAGANAFGVLTGQIFEPVGYSSDISGFLGACLLLTGIVAAIATAPLFDRVFTHRLALATKIVIPCVAGAWLSLIWAVKPNNLAGLFVVMTLIGVCSISLLPVALELAVEVTRNADGSSAILWLSGSLLGFIFTLVEGSLRADENASPPLNMRRALVFQGSFIMVASSLIFFVRGEQVRKRSDEMKLQEMREATNSQNPT